jgi:DNA ligase-1
MLKRRDAPYLPGRPKGQWWKWKRDPHIIDAVLMYAQRGHGKRSSYYSDYTLASGPMATRANNWCRSAKPISASPTRNCWRSTASSAATPPVFGPVRHVVHEPDQGLYWKSPSGPQRSPRHKSGVAMRFPRINRLRWDKPPREADRLETLERMLKTVTIS